MSRSVLPDRNTRVGRSDLHIQMRITNGVTHLLEITSRRKHGKGTDKRYLTAGRKSCRNACHITFRNTAVDMSVGECFLKDACLGSPCQVGVEHYQIRIFRTARSKCITITFTCSNLLNICH